MFDAHAVVLGEVVEHAEDEDEAIADAVRPEGLGELLVAEDVVDERDGTGDGEKDAEEDTLDVAALVREKLTVALLQVVANREVEYDDKSDAVTVCDGFVVERGDADKVAVVFDEADGAPAVEDTVADDAAERDAVVLGDGDRENAGDAETESERREVWLNDGDAVFVFDALTDRETLDDDELVPDRRALRETDADEVRERMIVGDGETVSDADGDPEMRGDDDADADRGGDADALPERDMGTLTDPVRLADTQPLDVTEVPLDCERDCERRADAERLGDGDVDAELRVDDDTLGEREDARELDGQDDAVDDARVEMENVGDDEGESDL